MYYYRDFTEIHHKMKEEVIVPLLQSVLLGLAKHSVELNLWIFWMGAINAPALYYNNRTYRIAILWSTGDAEWHSEEEAFFKVLVGELSLGVATVLR